MDDEMRQAFARVFAQIDRQFAQIDRQCAELTTGRSGAAAVSDEPDQSEGRKPSRSGLGKPVLPPETVSGTTRSWSGDNQAGSRDVPTPAGLAGSACGALPATGGFEAGSTQETGNLGPKGLSAGQMVEVKERLGLLEGSVASLSRRVDRIGGDVEQIKRRLDLVDSGT
jgi:hypothetical protein